MSHGWPANESTHQFQEFPVSHRHMLGIPGGDAEFDMVEKIQIFQEGALPWKDLT
jgi:hypothetical protein